MTATTSTISNNPLNSGVNPVNPANSTGAPVPSTHPATQILNASAAAQNAQPATQLPSWEKFQKLAVDVQKPDALLNANKTQTVLKARFGDALVDRVLKRFDFQTKTHFTTSEYRTILNGIAAHVKKDDLKARFESLKKLNDPTFSKFNSFDDLDEKHIGRLLKQFVSPAREVLEAKEKQDKWTVAKVMNIVMEVFFALAALTLIVGGALLFAVTFPISVAMAITGAIVAAVGLSMLGCQIYDLYKQRTINPPYHDKAVDDDYFVKMNIMSETFKFDKSQKVATSEFLAHEVAYLDLEEGQIVPIRHGKEMIHAKVSYSINKNGFVCFLLTPLQEHRHLDDYPVWELYRGTHDMKSLRRLGEPHSAGHSSFKLHAKELLEAKAEITKNAKAVKEIKVGHSLGGADAQRSLALTASKIAEAMLAKKPPAPTTSTAPLAKKVSILPAVDMAKVTPYLEKVRKICARVWNSAGIAKSTNELFKRSIQQIKAHEDPKGPKTHFEITLCKVGGDVIQQAGDTTIGYEMGNDPKVSREVFKFQYGLEGIKGFILNWGILGTAKAHQIKNTNRQINGGRDPEYAHYSAKTHLANVETECGDHVISMPGWEKVKWYLSSRIFGSSITDGKRYYTPQELINS